MESLVTLAITGIECIKNRQTNKQTDILLYIYRYITEAYQLFILKKIKIIEYGGGRGD